MACDNTIKSRQLNRDINITFRLTTQTYIYYIALYYALIYSITRTVGTSRIENTNQSKTDYTVKL